MSIIQIYALTSDKLDDQVVEWYINLEEAVCLLKNREIIIVIIDFSVKIGSGKD